MHKHLKLLSAGLMMTWLAGCATRQTVVVNPSRDVVRLAAPTRARVMTTTDGVTWKDAGKLTIPAGWYCTPGPE